MRVLERRLRRLEQGLLALAETAASRRDHEAALEIRRRRAARLGQPVPEDIPKLPYNDEMSIAERIRAARKQSPLEARSKQAERGAT